MTYQSDDVVRTRPLSGPTSARPSRRWMLTMLGLGLLVAAWVVVNPVSAAPQEPTYVVRSLQAVGGLASTRLLPPQPCFAHRPERTAACLASALPATNLHGAGAGVIAPFLTLPVGLIERVAANGYQATYLARALLGLICVLLLGTAARVLSRWGPWSLTGLVVAATPMLVFLSSTATTVGVETCAALCFGASLLACYQRGEGFGTLFPLVASGVLLALARPAGVAFMLATIIITLPLLRAPRWRGVRPLLALLVVGAASALEVSWSLGHQPHRAVTRSALVDGLHTVLSMPGSLLNLQVGIFGWQDTLPPALLFAAWELMAGFLAAVGLAVGERRLRLALVLAVVVSIGLAVGLRAVVVSPDWDLSGSYLLPTLAMVALVAGVALERSSLRPRLDTLLLGVGAAILQLVALWYEGRRYAVGRNGPLFFPPVAGWAPPGGWWPWLVLAAVGAVLLALSLLPPQRQRPAAQLKGSRPRALVFDTARVSVGR
jgi:hypothetical protein